MKREIRILNKQGQTLEGVLHDTGSTHIVVLCHAFRSTKEHFAMVKLADALESEGISAFRFDFSLTEYTEDSYYSGNYNSELEDLRAVVEYLYGVNRVPGIVLGHSKGANVVLEYASMYHDVGAVINVSGRYDPWHIDLKTKRASHDNEEHGTNIPKVWLTIDPKCKVLTVHGTADVDVALEDAFEICKCIADHQLQIVEGADHTYFSRLDELAAAVVTFAKKCVVDWAGEEGLMLKVEGYGGSSLEVEDEGGKAKECVVGSAWVEEGMILKAMGHDGSLLEAGDEKGTTSECVVSSTRVKVEEGVILRAEVFGGSSLLEIGDEKGMMNRFVASSTRVKSEEGVMLRAEVYGGSSSLEIGYEKGTASECVVSSTRVKVEEGVILKAEGCGSSSSLEIRDEKGTTNGCVVSTIGVKAEEGVILKAEVCGGSSMEEW